MGSCLALTLAAAWTLPASAQPTVLVVRAEAGLQDEAAALEARLVAGALSDGRDYAPTPPPSSTEIDEGWLGRATLEAEDHFARFDLASAAEGIARAMARLDREGPRGTTRSELVELALLNARIAQALGDTNTAEAAARRALVLQPDLTVDEERHPPTVTALVEERRASILRCTPRWNIRPSDARIALDGGPPAPLPETLACGTHWIAIEAPGYLGVSERIEVDDRDIEIALAIDPGAALALDATPSTPASPLARAAALLLDRELAFLDLSRDGDMISVRLGERSVRAPVGASADTLLALLDAAGHAGGLDVGVGIGIGVGAGVVLATLITTLAIVLSPTAPTDFELRGQILP